MRNTGLAIGLSGIAALALSGASGCHREPEPDTPVPKVGVYSPPPPGLARIAVGVPSFRFSGEGESSRLEELAADHLTTLLFQTRRFDVIERAEIEKILKEPHPEIATPGDLTKTSEARRVDSLFYGKVTRFSVKMEASSDNNPIDLKGGRSKVVAECDVDLRMVDPATGKVDAAHAGQFKRIDTIGAFGIDILGPGAEADAGFEMGEDEKGKIIRLVLDDALRKLLPAIDRALVARARTESRATPSAASPAVPSPPGAPAKKFCESCGQNLEAGAKFCPGCGSKA
jgi:curli biogenesis system outer membrane secretion channel CsgG